MRPWKTNCSLDEFNIQIHNSFLNTTPVFFTWVQSFKCYQWHSKLYFNLQTNQLFFRIFIEMLSIGHFPTFYTYWKFEKLHSEHLRNPLASTFNILVYILHHRIICLFTPLLFYLICDAFQSKFQTSLTSPLKSSEGISLTGVQYLLTVSFRHLPTMRYTHLRFITQCE